MSGAQGGLIVPAFAALAAACAFGIAAAVQHQQAGRAPQARSPSLKLLRDVARRPLWLAGIALATGAYGLQALALAYGPLTLVAPIVAADLLFALPLAARWARRPLRPRDWAGCLLVATGVAIFLSTSPPPGEQHTVPASDWILVFLAVGVITAAAIVGSRAVGRRSRAGLLAGATGVIFGLTAAVTASFTRSLRHDGVSSALSHWQLWVLILLGIAGLALSTSAYQAAGLSASLPIIDTVEPVSGVIIGAVLFNERLAASPSGLAVQFAAAAVAVAGIAMLGPSLAAVRGGAGRTGPAASAGKSGPGRACAGQEGPSAGQAGSGSRRARTGADEIVRALGRAPRPRAEPESARPGYQVPDPESGRDLLRVGRETRTAEERAEQLRP